MSCRVGQILYYTTIYIYIYIYNQIATVSDDDTLRIWRLGECYSEDTVEGTVKSLNSTRGDMTRIKSRQTPLKLNTAQHLNTTKLRSKGMIIVD